MKPIFSIFSVVWLLLLMACSQTISNAPTQEDTIHESIKTNADTTLIDKSPFTLIESNHPIEINENSLKAWISNTSNLQLIKERIINTSTDTGTVVYLQSLIGDINNDAVVDGIIHFEIKYSNNNDKEQYSLVLLNNGTALEPREIFFRGSKQSDYIIHFHHISENGAVVGKHIPNKDNPVVAKQLQRNKELSSYPLEYYWTDGELIHK